MLFPDPYTPHSYVDYTVGAGGILTSTTVFSFPKSFLQLDHIKVYMKDSFLLDVSWSLIAPSAYTLSGTTGAGVVTLGGSFPVRVDGNVIRFRRETPDTSAGRLIDFQAGSISSADLDSSALQDLFVAQEARDQVMAITLALAPVIPDLYGFGFSWASV